MDPDQCTKTAIYTRRISQCSNRTFHFSRRSAIFHLIFVVVFLYSGSLLCSAQSHKSNVSPNGNRPRAFAAPTGENALELDGEKKTFFKIGGWRDGIQKALFDETGGNSPPDFEESNDQFGREGPRFGAYDDNSVVEPNRESELWIPPPYRNETEEEKAATATTEAPTLPPTRPTLPPPPSTLRPLVATNIQNRAPIPVRTTPARGAFLATQPPPVLRPAQPFNRNNVAPQQPFVPNQQQHFIPQQTFQQQFVPQPPHQQFIPQAPPQQQFVQQPQQFVPQPQPSPQPPPLQPQAPNQRPVPQPQTPIQRPVPQPAPLQPQTPIQRPVLRPQPQTPIQRPAPQPAPPRPHPVMSVNFPAQPQGQIGPIRRPVGQQPRQPQQRPQPQLRPQAQPAVSPQPQSPRPLRPFQQPNNIASQPPRLTNANAVALRTGVCPNTIFYQTTLPAGWELQQTFSHFAMVVSIDQCARTCHEFNCAAAFFDPRTRHCQFNPSTVFSVPQGTCPQWPNPLYRNNIAISSQPIKIQCITCQRRRRNRPGVNSRFFVGQSTNGNTQAQAPRPAPQSVFQTTNQNRFGANGRVANAAAAALHGVTLEQPDREAIVVDERYGREKMVPQSEWKSLEELDNSSGDGTDSNPSAARTTIVPRLLSPLKIQPLQAKKYSSEENRASTSSPHPTDSFRRSRRMTQESAEIAGETKPVLQIA